MGEIDGIMKDTQHVLNLYLGLQRYHEACKIALIIANKEQTDGTNVVAFLLIII
jgi:hypothetical protein